MTRKKNDYRNPVETIDGKPPQVALTDPVEPDKFDRHMRKARKSDIIARRRIFANQSQAEGKRDTLRDKIHPSVY